MSAPGLFRPPPPRNEPVKDYAPGSPERASLRLRLEQMRNERLDAPLVIGGEDVRTGKTAEAVEPHDKSRVLADVHQGGAAEVERAIDAAGQAWEDWHRTPWEDRAAVFLRAADLLSGPWRDTLVAATMLGQSKTAHQAEIDAAAELIDFWRWNVEFMLRVYAEQPQSTDGVWNRMEYRPLEGFVFAVTPFNFTAIAGNLPGSAALMGNTVVWKPATTAMLSAHWLMRLLQEAGLPPGVINLVYGPGAEIGGAALDSKHLAGIHFTGSTSVFNSMWQTIGSNIAAGRYRNYPRIVGETGGKDFIVAHPSADVDAVATAILRGSFEYQGQKCSAASRVYAPSNLWPALRERLEQEVPTIRVGDVDELRELHGRRHRPEVVRDAAQGDRGGALERPGGDRRRRRRRRQRGLLRRADRDRDEGPAVPDDAGGALRPRRHDVRLPRGQVERHARARRVDRRRTGSPAPSSPRTAARSTRRRKRCATRPATSTSTTSRPVRSSASSRSAAAARRGRTTRPARCGTSSAG